MTSILSVHEAFISSLRFHPHETSLSLSLSLKVLPSFSLSLPFKVLPSFFLSPFQSSPFLLSSFQSSISLSYFTHSSKFNRDLLEQVLQAWNLIKRYFSPSLSFFLFSLSLSLSFSLTQFILCIKNRKRTKVLIFFR